MGRATQRQVEYAVAIAETLGIEPPEPVFEQCHAFISRFKEDYQRELYGAENDDFQANIAGLNAFLKDFGRIKTEELKYKLFRTPGIYAFVGSDDEILYIGKSINLAERILASYRDRSKNCDIYKILYYVTPTKADANILEILLIAENKPILNSDCNSEDFPQMFKSNISISKDFVLFAKKGE